MFEQLNQAGGFGTKYQGANREFLSAYLGITPSEHLIKILSQLQGKKVIVDFNYLPSKITLGEIDTSSEESIHKAASRYNSLNYHREEIDVPGGDLDANSKGIADIINHLFSGKRKAEIDTIRIGVNSKVGNEFVFGYTLQMLKSGSLYATQVEKESKPLTKEIIN